jgi:hypothetical protein
MNCNILKILFVALLAVSLFSCKTAEKTLYFQGELTQDNIQLHEKFIPLIKINDLLEIKLTASNDEAVKMLTPEIPNARSTVTYSSGGVAKGGCLAMMKFASRKNKIFGFDSFEGMPNITNEDLGNYNKSDPLYDFGKVGVIFALLDLHNDPSMIKNMFFLKKTKKRRKCFKTKKTS